jgi:hypothetical protein
VEVEPLLRRLQVPTLVVWGTGDVYFSVKWAYWLRDTIPGCRKVIELEGARLFFPAGGAGARTARSLAGEATGRHGLSYSGLDPQCNFAVASREMRSNFRVHEPRCCGGSPLKGGPVQRVVKCQ